MRQAWIALGAVAAFVLQTKVSLFGVAPDLTALLAYYLGITGGATRGMLLGCLIGALEDSVGGGILGPNLLGKGMVGFLSSFSSGSVFRWTPMLGVISLFLLTVTDGMVVFSSKTIFATMPSSLSTAVFVLFFQGTLNMSIGIFIKPKNVD